MQQHLYDVLPLSGLYICIQMQMENEQKKYRISGCYSNGYFNDAAGFRRDLFLENRKYQLFMGNLSAAYGSTSTAILYWL